jgi:hypothetical protein
MEGEKMLLLLVLLKFVGITSTPNAQSVTAITSAYQPSGYVFGEVPPQTVWTSKTSPGAVEFNVKPKRAAGTIQMVIRPTPAATPIFIKESGHFSFQPSKTDIKDFEIILTESAPGEPDQTQIIPLQVYPYLRPEAELLPLEATQLDPGSLNYIHIAEETGNAIEDFNGSRKTRSLIVSGPLIVIDQAKDQNQLFRILNAPTRDSGDIKDLTIHADRVIIRSRLNLPMTHVTIRARRLEFDDTGNTAQWSAIDTTPESRSKAAARTPKALRGRSGGALDLYIKEVDFGATGRARLITVGGKGEAAGEGMPGSPGPDIPLVTGWRNHPRATNYDKITHWRQFKGDQEVFWEGTYALPNNGGDAEPAGNPGDGGDAGLILSTIPIPDDAVLMTGGDPGDMGAIAQGGPPGRPVQWVIGRQKFLGYTQPIGEKGGSAAKAEYSTVYTYEYEGFRFAQPGHDAYPRGPGSQGASGKPSQVDAKIPAWLSPELASAVLVFVKDLYLHNNGDEAVKWLDNYSPQLEEAISVPDPDPRLVSFAQEYAAYRYQISANRDFFGNVAGWVPNLSLEANLRAYKNEIDNALRVFYLKRLFDARKMDRVKQIAVLEETIKVLTSEITDAKRGIIDTLQIMPKLQYEIQAVAREESRIQDDIASLDQQLQTRAHSRIQDLSKGAFWKKAARVLSMACKVVPVYQPVLGVVGQGLSMVSNIDTNTPLQTIAGMADVAAQFNATALADSKKSLDDFASKLDPKNTAGTMDYVKHLAEVGSKLAPAVSQIGHILQQRQVPATELDAELALIRATSPEYVQLTARVADLSRRKAELAQHISDSTSQIASLSKNLLTSLLARDDLSKASRSQSAILDHRAVQCIDALDQQARERHIRYQYYTARSYEYRFLQTYPVDYNLGTVGLKVEEILKSPEHPAGVDDYTALRPVYDTSIRNALDHAFQILNQKPPKLTSDGLQFDLTDDERSVLNRDGSVRIRIRDKIWLPLKQENCRIAGLVVSKIQCTIPKPLPRVASLAITVKHSGRSYVRTGDTTYAFDHRNSGDYPSFSWGATIDALTNEIKPYIVSNTWILEVLTTLGFSLEDARNSTNPFVLLVRPGADAELTISRDSITRGTDNITIDNLVFSMSVDFFPGSEVNSQLLVETSGNLRPHIQCDQDLTGRSNGIGAFERIYRSGAVVRLVAPTSLGSSRFKAWLNDAGAEVSTQPAIDVTLDKSQVRRALYVNPKEIDSPR